MPRNTVPAGKCPKCGRDELSCSYNHFERDELIIDAWEHKCANCGFRDTTGYRTDEPESLADIDDPQVCPYCGRQGEVT
ncbi:MAG: hypothetical protein NXI22_24155 [bacterium]|nr:hypothetical protein [bacterium]